MKNLSLKFKLLWLLVSVTTLMLGAYGFLALHDFERDKIAYVYDASSTHVRSTASQIRTEIEFISNKLRFYLRGYNPQAQQFSPYSRAVFSGESELKGLWVFSAKQTNGAMHETDRILRGDGHDIKMPEGSLHKMLEEAMTYGVSLRLDPEVPSQWYLALVVRGTTASHNPPSVIVGWVRQGRFLEAFSGSSFQDTYLVNSAGMPLLRPLHPKNPIEPKTETQLISTALSQLKSSSGVLETSGRLVASARVQAGELRILSVLPKNQALQALKVIAAKSVLFFLILVCMTVAISILASGHLTAALKRLLVATQRISRGQFDVELDTSSADEVGGLARGVQKMAGDIQKLLAATSEKARMENELQTARVVQSTLFPPAEFSTDVISIRGHYEPASECGGDWWFFSQIGNRTYFWIGDATGHGVGAALVTSAARSAASVLEKFSNLNLEQILALLNGSIHHTAKGNVLMTFFLACFDSESGEFSYCNASHDPPFLIRKAGDQPLQKKDILPLADNRGPRLGEDENSTYQSTSLRLNPGDKVIFYTDGVTEMKNSEGQLWGERRFIKCLLKSLNQDDSISAAMKHLNSELNAHKCDAPLDDDVTYFMFQYNSAS